MDETGQSYRQEDHHHGYRHPLQEVQGHEDLAQRLQQIPGRSGQDEKGGVVGDQAKVGQLWSSRSCVRFGRFDKLVVKNMIYISQMFKIDFKA